MPRFEAMSAGDWIFALTNVVIVAGYVFTALKVAPLLPVRTVTRLAAISFFALCAMTHLDQAVHTFFSQRVDWAHIISAPHMLFIHIPQAISVWVFAVSFFRDLRDLREDHAAGRVSRRARRA